MIAAWIVFNVVLIVLILFDLYLTYHHAHTLTFKKAVGTSLAWIALALLFCLALYFLQGPNASLDFLTAYFIEKSLSVDNLFVFILIFKTFQVSPYLQHKVLFYGILGAIILRLIFIFLGVALLQHFHFVYYLFGLFLVYSGIKIAFKSPKSKKEAPSRFIGWFQKFFSVKRDYKGERFFVKIGKKRMVTPLFLALLAIEGADVLFAVDSIPAVLAITTDIFIVYTSNILAIVGLRSLYFVLQRLVDVFHYLHYALALILVFIGLKMILLDWVHISSLLSLGIVLILLGLAIAFSSFFPKKKTT